MPQLNLDQWNEFVSHQPDAHLLQTGAWGELKAAFGWQVVRLQAGDAGAQVLFRSLPLGYSLAYIPKGPVGPDWDALWPEIDALCRERKAVFLKVEPDHWHGDDSRLPADFIPSRHTIQPRRTVMLSLSGDEDEILARMKQKTRYNIRLSAKKDVSVLPSDDLQTFSEMAAVTGQRDGFGVHNLAYYQRAYDLFHPGGNCELLLAEYEGRPLAALMVFAQGSRAWYLYGVSNNAERNRMPAYGLQWAAMQWARTQGCTEYDMWGVPDEDEEVLEAEFTSRSDGLWGVYRFKRGFGGEVKRTLGAFDRVSMPTLYKLYQLYFRFRGI
ncbi:MAG: peptidoglycan bridge formation glycyltransferase FemA/FemB family protein [Anaerolineae bacterium]|nr:peptidoglycan bridge formation glycyltransferase FemA/FemB family protein [Anaerolineae bacterium]